jgi:hypothetical protein
MEIVMPRIPAFLLASAVVLTSAAGAGAQINVDQDASRNHANINQHQSDHGPVKNRTFTTGNAKNSVTHVQQRGPTTDPVTVTQSGDTNKINAHQRADTNSFSSTQTGHNNSANVRQSSPH